MAKLTKRLRIIREKLDVTKNYDVKDAILLLKECSQVKFTESVDVAINLGIDSRKSDQNIRGSIILPHGTGRSVRIAVFAEGLDVTAAKAAGADIVGMEDLAEQIKKGIINFDILIASPDTMRLVSPLGKILGPKGLMPNPKIGTVNPNIIQAVRDFKIGQIGYRNDKNGIVHVTIGKINFDTTKLEENLETLLVCLKKDKPSLCKGSYIKKVTISTTMGIGITVNHIDRI